jgi:hypothetical protein
LGNTIFPVLVHNHQVKVVHLYQLNYVVEIGRSQEQYALRSKQRDRVQPQAGSKTLPQPNWVDIWPNNFLEAHCIKLRSFGQRNVFFACQRAL